MLIILLWTILSFIFSEVIVPYPWLIIKKIFFLLLNTDIYSNLLITSLRTITGFLLAFIIGAFIGILTGSFKFIEKSFFIPVVLLQGAPPILWIIPLMLIFGTNGASPVAVVFFVVLPLVIINVQEGIKSISKDKWDMFRIYANSKFLKLTELILPSLSSYIKSIFILGIILALKSSIIGEWFGAKNGIGRIINEYFYTFNMISFYSVSVIFLIFVSIIAFLTNKFSNKIFQRKKNNIVHIKKREFSDFFTEKKNVSLVIKNLSFSYGKKNILNNINLNINNSKPIVLTGESGCGKTTFAKIAVGLIKNYKGKVIIPKNPCLIFQDDLFLDHLDSFGNASLPARWKKIDNYENITINLLEKCGLKEQINYFPDQLSGGMKKRVTFARALVLNPDFIILDEPFTNLHKDARKRLWDLYFELFIKNKILSIIITHYPEDLKDRKVCFYELKDGKIEKIK